MNPSHGLNQDEQNALLADFKNLLGRLTDSVIKKENEESIMREFTALVNKFQKEEVINKLIDDYRGSDYLKLLNKKDKNVIKNYLINGMNNIFKKYDINNKSADEYQFLIKNLIKKLNQLVEGRTPESTDSSKTKSTDSFYTPAPIDTTKKIFNPKKYPPGGGRLQDMKSSQVIPENQNSSQQINKKKVIKFIGKSFIGKSDTDNTINNGKTSNETKEKKEFVQKYERMKNILEDLSQNIKGIELPEYIKDIATYMSSFLRDYKRNMEDGNIEKLNENQKEALHFVHTLLNLKDIPNLQGWKEKYKNELSQPDTYEINIFDSNKNDPAGAFFWMRVDTAINPYEEDLNISEIDLEKSKKNYLDEKNLTKSSNKIIKITTMDNNLYKSAPFHKSK